MSESFFFQDLALLMAVAGLVSVLCAKFKWPKVIGYILAGVVMGKYTWGGAFLADEASVQTIGQLGVVFLMFAMGLDFSPSQMNRIRRVAIPTALIDTIIMTWLGYTLGRSCFGWGTVPSLFLGVAMCDSATTMLAKVIGEMNWNRRNFVKYALGTSVCEDIVCVGILALITGVAQGGGVSFKAAALSMGGLFLFFLAVIVFGFVLVPRLLKSINKTRDTEALLLTVLGCCFLVSWIAFKFEFSLALGAFLVGIIVASSDVHHKLQDFSEPLKSMFAAVFFVSVGLLLDPMACWTYLPQILLVAAVVVVGKTLNCTFGALVTGESVKTAVQMGMSLAQIGEFAFMVAILYFTVTGDTQTPIFSIAVAVLVLTTLLNPLMIRASEPTGDWLERHLPRRFHAWFETYRGLLAKVNDDAKRERRLKVIVRSSLIQIGVLLALNFAVSISFALLNEYDWSKFSAFFNDHKQFVFCLCVNIFVIAMLAPAVKIAQRLSSAISSDLVGAGTTKWQMAVRHIVSLAVIVVVVLLFFLEMAAINVHLAPTEVWARWTIRGVLLLVAIFGWRFFLKAGQRAASRFDEALTAEERREKLGQMLTLSVPEGTLHHLTLPEASPAVGATVVTLNIRAKTGASIVAVERDGKKLRNIGPETEFQIGDTLIALGDGSQIASLKDLLGITA